MYSPINPICKQDETTNDLQFSPPVYRQRYSAALNVIEDLKYKSQIEKVVDFGCSELSFIAKLRNVDFLSSVLAVDCDAALLKEHCYRIEPSNRHFFDQREKPFNITVLHGSVCDPDYRLIGCDVVTCIELIEHLNPGTLDRLPHNIFGYIEPLIAIITTPNAEFNVLFSQMKANGFRHFDHRFEWTREQFQDWANHIVTLYPKYSVEFIGIGPGPEGTEDLGCCSQMALFVNKNYSRKTEIVVEESSENSKQHVKPISEEIDILTNKYKNDNPTDVDSEKQNIENTFIWDNINWDRQLNIFYDVIKKYDYPYFVDDRNESEKILSEVSYRIQLLATYDSMYFDDQEYIWKIPLAMLISPLFNIQVESSILSEILINNGFKVVDGHLIHEDTQIEKYSDTDEDICLEIQHIDFDQQDEQWDV